MSLAISRGAAGPLVIELGEGWYLISPIPHRSD